MKPTRVLIVDDSAAVRRILADVIGADPALSVMGTASDPLKAVDMIRQERPDVITLDVEMPHMDGVTFLKKIMMQHPIPVVMCSAHLEENSTGLLDALAAGAIDVIQKPKLGAPQYIEDARDHICSVIKNAAGARLSASRAIAQPIARPVDPPRKPVGSLQSIGVVAVGASTGGTEAVAAFLSALPPDSPPVVIVQHMPPDFTRPFAARLNALCTLDVKEAECSDRLIPGRALIAPGGIHTLIVKDGIDHKIELRDGPHVAGHAPSVDVLFRSAARSTGKNSIGIILTGMGKDGARGLRELRQTGALTIGQDQATSVVYGMPLAALEAGAVSVQLPLDRIAAYVVQHFECKRQSRPQ